MAVLRPDPDLFDVEGWRQLVEELRAAPEEDANPDLLFYAEAHLAAILETPEKAAAEAT